MTILHSVCRLHIVIVDDCMSLLENLNERSSRETHGRCLILSLSKCFEKIKTKWFTLKHVKNTQCGFISQIISCWAVYWASCNLNLFSISRSQQILHILTENCKIT